MEIKENVTLSRGQLETLIELLPLAKQHIKEVIRENNELGDMVANTPKEWGYQQHVVKGREQLQKAEYMIQSLEWLYDEINIEVVNISDTEQLRIGKVTGDTGVPWQAERWLKWSAKDKWHLDSYRDGRTRQEALSKLETDPFYPEPDNIP